MKISEYRKKTTRVEQTPGGLFVRVRALRMEDFFSLGMNINTMLPEKGVSDESRRESMRKALKEKPDTLCAMQKMVLARATTLVDETGKPTGEKIVDKLPEEITDQEKEISWQEFSTEDLNFIVKLATEISGMGKEEAQPASLFPEKSEASHNP